MILFCSIVLKLITVHSVLGSGFQAYLFESFGKKNKKEVFLGIERESFRETIIFFNNTTSIYFRKIKLVHLETLHEFFIFFKSPTSWYLLRSSSILVLSLYIEKSVLLFYVHVFKAFNHLIFGGTSPQDATFLFKKFINVKIFSFDSYIL